ncbi:hypothetical protein ACHAXT_010892 [Thalassiosira profunda]
MGKRRVVLAVHGGAGIILRSQLTSEKEGEYRAALREAMAAGYGVLTSCDCDASSPSSVAVDAVEAAVRFMEDNPLFNAGRGSVFAHDGEIRMDASIMACAACRRGNTRKQSFGESEGDTMIATAPDEDLGPQQIVQRRRYPQTPQPQAGAVAGVQRVRNPISLARAVMERTPHVMLIGKGAEEFAAVAGVDIETDDRYFWTERRWKQLVDVREREQRQRQSEEGGEIAKLSQQTMKVQLDHASESNPDELDIGHDKHKFGTVGCIALYEPAKLQSVDDGVTCPSQLAAATSTGGMTNQRYHRVGDSPVIGAGTYANNLCAVSCTGHGEHFIRCVAAHDIAKRLEYRHGYGDVSEGKGGNALGGEGCALQNAVDEVIFGTLMGDGADTGGDGGAIALDKDGNFAAEMNCPGMYHGWVYEDGTMETRVFWDERPSENEA